MQYDTHIPASYRYTSITALLVYFRCKKPLKSATSKLLFVKMFFKAFAMIPKILKIMLFSLSLIRIKANTNTIIKYITN